MCGIVGILSDIDISIKILSGLRLLEYRGYDSLGIATINDGIVSKKVLGKVDTLEEQLSQEPLHGTTGIGHTRWASHGAPTIENTHPILSEKQKIAVVHNGIIENYLEIKCELSAKGYHFHTQTDSEVIAALIEQGVLLGFSPIISVQKAIKRLKGIFAIAVIFSDYPDLLIGAKRGSNLVIGISKRDGEYFLASDENACAAYCDNAIYLEDGESVEISRDGYVIFDDSGAIIQPNISHIESNNDINRGHYQTFMLKEIYEQPKVLAGAIERYRYFDKLVSGSGIEWNEIKVVNIVACGSSLYAGHVAKYWLESEGRVVNLVISSEFRLSNSLDYRHQLFIFISQSGETADTLAALKKISPHTNNIVGIVNAKNSSIARAVRLCIEIFAGAEIAVASTKSFTNQLAALAALTISISPNLSLDILDSIRGLEESLALDVSIKMIAQNILAHCEKVLCIGRGCGYPLALEGALKLRELTYIPALGIAAGELKHGSMALIDSETPVIAIAPSNDPSFSKMISSIHEVKARGGRIILLSDKSGIEQVGDLCESSLEISYCSNEFVMPFLYTIPLQLLAHHTAIAKKLDVDRPRNLAKSITVE